LGYPESIKGYKSEHNILLEKLVDEICRNTQTPLYKSLTLKSGALFTGGTLSRHIYPAAFGGV